MPNGTTPAELAEQHNTSQRRVRRVLRSLDLGVGRGKRYNLNAKQVKQVTAKLAPAEQQD